MGEKEVGRVAVEGLQAGAGAAKAQAFRAERETDPDADRVALNRPRDRTADGTLETPGAVRIECQPDVIAVAANAVPGLAIREQTRRVRRRQERIGLGCARDEDAENRCQRQRDRLPAHVSASWPENVELDRMWPSSISTM